MAALAAGEPGVTAEATKVVVVEDDPASADVLRRRLQANGMHVDVAGDGLGGLRLVQEVRPDLVLLDVMLPDTDGYDVCLRIKSDPETADIPVIFLSARGEVVDKVRGLSCGAADYVTKPFQAAELLARIDAVLGQARNPRAPRLARPLERSASGRLVARLAIADQALREHVVALVAPRFDLATDPRAHIVLVGELTPDERAQLERHPVLGEEVLAGFHRLQGLLPIVRHHHERLDGTGYPDHLKAEQIPLEVRIVTVADRFEALLVDRADRSGISEAEAVRILQAAVGRRELEAAVGAAPAAPVGPGGAT